MTKLLRILGVLLAVCVITAGCGGKGDTTPPAVEEDNGAGGAAETPPPDAAPVESEILPESPGDAAAETAEMDISEDSIRVRSADGGFSLEGGESATLPEDFPKDVPLPDTFKLKSVMRQAGEETVFMLMGTAPLSLGEAVKAVEDTASENGWKEEMQLDQGAEMAMRTYTQDGRTWHATMGVEGEEAVFTWTVSQ